MATNNLARDDGYPGQKELPAPGCEHTFGLNGDQAKCSLPAGHEGDHRYEVPTLRDSYDR